MFGEAFVQEGVIGSEQIDYAAVFADDAFGEQVRFSEKGLAEVVIEIGEDLLIGRGGLQIPQIEPLAEEVLDERVGAAIGEHAPDLLLQHGWFVELAGGGKVEELVIGDAAP
ncbi:MAG TPA: hypothetical protein VH640_15705 [Bryobacteraceae bacterium]